MRTKAVADSPVGGTANAYGRCAADEEGYYSVFGKSGARIEIPGCPCVWVTRRV